MPFAWTAIHLIDIINGVAHNDPATAATTEKDAAVTTASQRKVSETLDSTQIDLNLITFPI